MCNPFSPLKLLIIKLLIKDGSCFLLEIAHVLVKIGLARQMGWICCYSELGSLAPQNPLTEKLPNMMIDANFELITIKFITEWFHHLQTTHNMPNPLRLNTVRHSHNHSKSLWHLSSATSSSSRPASPPINITRCGGCCLRTKCNSVNLSWLTHQAKICVKLLKWRAWRNCPWLSMAAWNCLTSSLAFWEMDLLMLRTIKSMHSPKPSKSSDLPRIHF